MSKRELYISEDEIERIEERNTAYSDGREYCRHTVYLKNRSYKKAEAVYEVNVAGEFKMLGYLDSSGKRIIEY